MILSALLGIFLESRTATQAKDRHSEACCPSYHAGSACRLLCRADGGPAVLIDEPGCRGAGRLREIGNSNFHSSFRLMSFGSFPSTIQTSFHWIHFPMTLIR